MDIMPAVIKLDDRMDKMKFKIVCDHCRQPLVKGETVFYSKPAGHKFWHMKDLSDGTRCYDPAWKKPGTPYDVRRKMAIAYQTNKLSVPDQIKLALRRFRRELMIPADKMGLHPEVYQYLIKHHLIEMDDFKGAYVIIPKGFSWDVDSNCVRVPTFDEDIMQRDANVEKSLDND